MANQYTLTTSFSALTETSGTIQNVGIEAVELATTTNATEGQGIILAPSEKMAFKGNISARAMGGTTPAKINVVDFTEAAGGGDGVPLGVILPFAGNGTIPGGFLLCDGAAYSRTALPDLFACIGTTYGSGDGSTTFNVPDANQAKRFLQGDTVAGQTKEAGLPNITGSFWHSGANVSTNIGSFRYTLNNLLGVTSGSAAGDGAVDFDASRSSSIYGNSTTVQPDALTTRYIIKAFDGQTADSALIDITQYANELAGKADRSLSNLTDAGKSFSFPSDTYITLSATWGGADGSYSTQIFTAPADGYAFFREKSSAMYDGRIRDLDNELGSYVVVSSKREETIECYLPVKKGARYQFFKIGNSGAQICRFYYAAGEVPTA